MGGDEPSRRVVRDSNQALWDTVEGELRRWLMDPHDASRQRDSVSEALEALETLRIGFLDDQEHIAELEDELLKAVCEENGDNEEAPKRPRKYQVPDIFLGRLVDALLDEARQSRLNSHEMVVPEVLLREIGHARNFFTIYGEKEPRDRDSEGDDPGRHGGDA